MTASRTFFQAGGAATAADVQRVSDAAAFADDRVQDALFAPDATGLQKRVVSLSDEHPSAISGAAGTGPSRFIVIPNPGGTVALKPCRIIISSGFNISIGITTQTPTVSPQGPVNAGANRYDLLYATVRRATTSATRKVKSPDSGSVGSAVLTIEEHYTLSLGIAPGTSTLDKGVLPPDDVPAQVYNIPLAYLYMVTGRVATTEFNQDNIVPAYSRGIIAANRIQSLRSMSIFDGTSPQKPVVSNWGGHNRSSTLFTYYGGWNHTTASQPFIVLDDSIDWTRRMIWGHALYYGVNMPEQMKTSSLVSTATAPLYGEVRIPAAVFKDNTLKHMMTFPNIGRTWYLMVDAYGALGVGQEDSGAPQPVTPSDEYGIVLFATDRMRNY